MFKVAPNGRITLMTTTRDGALNALDPTSSIVTGSQWRSVADVRHSWAGGLQLLVEGWGAGSLTQVGLPHTWIRE